MLRLRSVLRLRQVRLSRAARLQVLPRRLTEGQHATHKVEVHHRAPRARRDAAEEKPVRRCGEAPAAEASPSDKVREYGTHNDCATKLHPERPCIAHVCVGCAVRDVDLVGVGEPGRRGGEDAAGAVHVRPEQRAALRGGGFAALAAAGLVPAPAAAVEHHDPVARAVAWRGQEVVAGVGAVVTARIRVRRERDAVHRRQGPTRRAGWQIVNVKVERSPSLNEIHQTSTHTRALHAMHSQEERPSSVD